MWGPRRRRSSRRHDGWSHKPTAIVVVVALAAIGWCSSRSSPRSATSSEADAAVNDHEKAALVLETSYSIEVATDGSDVFLAADDQLHAVGAEGRPSPLLKLTPDQRATALAADRAAVYWADGGCSKGSKAKAIHVLGRNGEPARMISEGRWCVSSMAVDESAVYWLAINGGKDFTVKRADKLTLTTTIVVEAEGLGSARDLSSHGEWLYLVVGGDTDDIVRVAKTGTSAEVLVTENEIFGYAVDGEQLYWSAAIGDARGAIRMITSGGPITLAELDHRPKELVLNAAWLWWFHTDPSPDVLMRMPSRGGEPEHVRRLNDDRAGDLLFPDGYVYWTTLDGDARLLRATTPP